MGSRRKNRDPNPQPKRRKLSFAQSKMMRKTPTQRTIAGDSGGPSTGATMASLAGVPQKEAQTIDQWEAAEDIRHAEAMSKWNASRSTGRKFAATREGVGKKRAASAKDIVTVSKKRKGRSALSIPK